VADRLASSSYPASVPARRAIAARLSILAGLVLAAAACGSILPTAPSTGPDYALNVNNDTTLALTIMVNGQRISVVGAKTAAAFQPAGLPAMPWLVEAHSSRGRLVLRLGVAVGSVTEGVGPNDEHERGAPGARVDLSCGRLDMYPGDTPTLGPAPGRGVPGDCVP
jgi:hypothetical protein